MNVFYFRIAVQGPRNATPVCSIRFYSFEALSAYLVQHSPRFAHYSGLCTKAYSAMSDRVLETAPFSIEDARQYLADLAAARAAGGDV